MHVKNHGSKRKVQAMKLFTCSDVCVNIYLFFMSVIPNLRSRPNWGSLGVWHRAAREGFMENMYELFK